MSLKEFFQRNKKAILEWAGLTLLFLSLSLLYIHPGEKYLLSGSQEFVLSDGTDQTTAPFQVSMVKQVFENNPLDLFYGGLPTRMMNGPEGMVHWINWLEKWSYLLFSYLLPAEQASIGYLVMLLFLNCIFMYILGRLFGWSKGLSVLASIAFAFTAYTRARAKVHVGFSGTFIIPALFIALLLIKNNKSRKHLIVASALLLLVAMGPYYYLFMLAFLSPLFLLYYLYGTKRAHMLNAIKRLMICTLPAALFCLYSVLVPAPSAFTAQTQAVVPQTGQHMDGDYHSFLHRFSARPIDYLSGDIGIGVTDLNPLRELINKSIYNNFDGSNPHERANGLRWCLLFVPLLLIFLAIKRETFSVFTPYRYWLIFTFVAFLLSLSPNWWGLNIGPSLWIHKLASVYRVPSRASIFVNFGLVIILMQYLSTLKISNGKLAGLFAIVLLELPPIVNPMPIARVLPAHTSIQGLTTDRCGLGMQLPYVNTALGQLEIYQQLQRMRGSGCMVMNPVQVLERDVALINAFPFHQDFINAINSKNTVLDQKVLNFTRCAGLSWLSFHPAVPLPWRENICSQLSGQMLDMFFCRIKLGQPTYKINPECYKAL